MSTRKDVARLAGVSVATVSNVFLSKNIVSPETVSKVKAVAKSLNYVPDHTARSLSLGRNNHIGIAINESTNPFHMELVKIIEDCALSKGFLVTVFDLNGSQLDKTAFIENRALDALVNFTTVRFYDEFFNILKSRNTIMVNFGLDKGMSFGHDEKNAMIDCMNKLKSLGHKNVGFVSTQDSYRLVADERSKTFLDNREKMGFSLNRDYLECCEDCCFNSAEFGYEGTKRLMSRHEEITALFTTNDIAAIGAIRALKDLGYRCPEDVSVIGCDNIMLGTLHVPSLSTIAFDKTAYSVNMAEMIIDCVINKKSGVGYEFKVPSKAIFRESVSVCRKK